MKVFAAFLLMICLSTLEFGCFFGKNDFVEPVNYDLSLPEKSLTVPVPVEFELCRNLSGTDRRMALRYSDKRVVADEYNRWLLPPEVMLQRMFIAALSAKDAADLPAVKVVGVLYRFDFEVEEKMAAAAAEFTFRFRNAVIRRNIVKKATCKADTAAARAAAMDQAVAEMAAEVARVIAELPVTDGGGADAVSGREVQTKEKK